MTVLSIGPATALLYLTQEQLYERGLHPDTLTHAHTAALAREGLALLGQTAEIAQLESYPDKAGLLLFVHTAPAVWRFFDSDALLDAINALPGLDGQRLYRWKGAFWFIGQGSGALSEFADRTDDPLLGTRLAEYAQPLS